MAAWNQRPSVGADSNAVGCRLPAKLGRGGAQVVVRVLRRVRVPIRRRAVGAAVVPTSATDHSAPSGRPPRSSIASASGNAKSGPPACGRRPAEPSPGLAILAPPASPPRAPSPTKCAPAAGVSGSAGSARCGGARPGSRGDPRRWSGRARFRPAGGPRIPSNPAGLTPGWAAAGWPAPTRSAPSSTAPAPRPGPPPRSPPTTARAAASPRTPAASPASGATACSPAC